MNIADRKTIRKYKAADVGKDLIHSLLGTAARAATMGNMQLYSVIETRTEVGKAALAPLHFNQPMVTGAPVVLTFVADFRRFTRWCDLSDADAGYDNLLSFLNAATDTLLFCQNFCTLAEEAGLGTCFLGTTIYNPKGVIAALDLPMLTFPVATITVGWPNEDPAQTDRLDIEALIHEETYKDVDDEAIRQIYAYKESLAENKHFVEINHKQNLAQVFTDCRYTRKDNEAMSEALLETLHLQGFIK
ncbi:MAG: nitroreductase family protein [Prevotella sp.]|nr:nitroreductase family protein [Prevotella sp.]